MCSNHGKLVWILLAYYNFLSSYLSFSSYLLLNIYSLANVCVKWNIVLSCLCPCLYLNKSLWTYSVSIRFCLKSCSNVIAEKFQQVVTVTNNTLISLQQSLGGVLRKSSSEKFCNFQRKTHVMVSLFSSISVTQKMSPSQ